MWCIFLDVVEQSIMRYVRATERARSSATARSLERHFCSASSTHITSSSTHSTSPPIPIYPHLPHIYNMFAARQVSQSVVGAVQRRAFSASASNVSELNSQQNKTIRSNGDRPSIEPLQAHPLTLMLPCSSPRLPSSVPVAESASLCLSSSSSTRVSPTSPSSTFAVPPALPLMSATSTPRALYVATRYEQDRWDSII